jgi:hypothetical protein
MKLKFRSVTASLLMTMGAVLAGPALRAAAASPALVAMPADLEARFALSALPATLRDQATVYLLEPATGYRLSRRGTNGIACLVERTTWELADFRDDIYVPLCYDAAGLDAHFKVIMDAAQLRAQGMDAQALKDEIDKRYAQNIYRAPQKFGLSYMIAPIMRTIGPPDLQVHTMAMPHLMFYAPYVTNEEIGAKPDLADMNSLRYPFIDRQGNAQQSYMIQMIGETEKADILASEKQLLADLCRYRDVLCLAHTSH